MKQFQGTLSAIEGKILGLEESKVLDLEHTSRLKIPFPEHIPCTSISLAYPHTQNDKKLLGIGAGAQRAIHNKASLVYRGSLQTWILSIMRTTAQS